MSFLQEIVSLNLPLMVNVFLSFSNVLSSLGLGLRVKLIFLTGENECLYTFSHDNPNDVFSFITVRENTCLADTINFKSGSLFSYSKYYSECHTVEINYGGEISNLAALWFTYPNAHRMVNLLLLLSLSVFKCI